jgi:hypothetical protein
MKETNISVKKEILTINRSAKNLQQAEITVYYEFYNPGETKTMIVGLEAISPEGDADFTPVNGQQPYIHNFTVEMNEQHLSYQVAIVSDSLYYQNGKFKALTSKQIKEAIDTIGDDPVGFRYAYHFQADFKKGLNIIQHTYTCDFSTFVGSNYEFGYLLSPAMRWGNKQIDDFTLNINMGDEQWINIPKTFFKNADEWTIVGAGKKADTKSRYYEIGDEQFQPTVNFYIKKGYITFQKQNFKPKGELHFSSPHSGIDDNFNYKVQTSIIPNIFTWTDYNGMTTSDEISKKILRNLPFAQRGYIFSTPEIQKYFEKQVWYFPDSTYKPDMAKLSNDEQKWVEYWSK